MKRILFYVHYNKFNLLSEYVVYQLNELKKDHEKIIFISNSILDKDSINILNTIVDSISLRSNTGYDFYAWKKSFEDFSYSELSQYDTVTIMNDTCFGPIIPLNPIFTQMDKSGSDFWGITKYPFTKNGMPGSDSFVNEHLQSYFIVFKKKLVQSSKFQKFWNTVEIETNVESVIAKYETMMTKYFKDNGFSYDSIVSINDFSHYTNPNIATFRPDLILNNKSPFIKIKSFLYFEYPNFIINKISLTTKYPVSLIESHISTNFQPDLSSFICSKKNIVGKLPNSSISSSLKIAIYFHVFYVDVFEQYLSLINNIDFIDFIITTDTIEKKTNIIDLFNKKNFGSYEIILLPNHGRDILPFITIFNKLENYDIIGKFHTKKTSFESAWVGDSWMFDIFESLLLNLNDIINLFMNNSNLGIIIPDLPYHILYNSMDIIGSNSEAIADLINILKLPKKINLESINTYIMPVGTMFWCRPKALLSLQNLNNFADFLPEEPFPNDGTYAHALERLFVYITWANGYDYMILSSNNLSISRFANRIISEKNCNFITKQTQELNTRATIYYKMYNGLFDEKFSSQKELNIFKDPNFDISFNLKDHESNMRFDPVENIEIDLLLTKFIGITSVEEIDLSKHLTGNFIKINNIYRFSTKDPNIYFHVDKEITEIQISGKIFIRNELYETKFELSSVYNSFTWKLGTIILYVPKKILKLLMKILNWRKIE